MRVRAQALRRHWLRFPAAPWIALVAAASCAWAASRMPYVSGHGAVAITVSLPAATTAVAPANILRPITARDALKENAERAFATRPDSAALPFRFAGDPVSEARALHCLTQAVYYEAAGEGVPGERAVAQVILNRVRHPGFPASVCGVVYQGSGGITGCQFTFTCDGSLTRIPAPILWKEAEQIARQALDGLVFTPVGHATHYHANYILPYWADSLDKSAEIGHHLFYRLKGSPGDASAFTQNYARQEPAPGPILAAVIVAGPNGLDTPAIPDPARLSLAPEAVKSPAAKRAELVADASQGTLRADVGAAPAIPPGTSAPPKSGDCPAVPSIKLRPLLPKNVKTADLGECSG